MKRQKKNNYEWQKAHRNRITDTWGPVVEKVKKIRNISLYLCRHCYDTHRWTLSHGSRTNYNAKGALKRREYRTKRKWFTRKPGVLNVKLALLSISVGCVEEDDMK